MQKVAIIGSGAGFTVAEVSAYTYGDGDTARAFAKDKWGDGNPTVAVDSSKLAELLAEIDREYRRATWESAEDWSEQPNHPHVRLGRLLDQLHTVSGIPKEEL